MEAISRTVCPSVVRGWGVAHALWVWIPPRSSIYHRWRSLQRPVKTDARRGTKRAHTDAGLPHQLRSVLWRSRHLTANGIARRERGCDFSVRSLSSAERGKGSKVEQSYRSLAPLDDEIGGGDPLAVGGKLPLGGSKWEFSAYLEAWVQYPK